MLVVLIVLFRAENLTCALNELYLNTKPELCAENKNSGSCSGFDIYYGQKSGFWCDWLNLHKVAFLLPAVVEPGLSKTNIFKPDFLCKSRKSPPRTDTGANGVARDSRHQQARGPLHPAAEARSGSGIKPGGFLDTGCLSAGDVSIHRHIRVHGGQPRPPSGQYYAFAPGDSPLGNCLRCLAHRSSWCSDGPMLLKLSMRRNDDGVE